ncbi:MAG: hypothetical protein JXB88_07620 [Spirochaetales bacterium]|nr:hypothetical protein [Spirochaetales bacterium]
MPENKELDIGISKYAREKVIEHLKYSFTHDFLEEADFEKRCNIAVNTQNRHDLKTLVEDLPEYKEEQDDLQSTTPSVPINTGKIQEESNIVCLLSGTERKGMWKPPKKINIFVAMGGVDLDFTQAFFPPGIIEINVFCIMGGVDIKIPNGVHVENHCLAFMGGVDDRSIPGEDKNGPTLRIKGIVFMSGLDIKTPKEGLMKRILKKLKLE